MIVFSYPPREITNSSPFVNRAQETKFECPLNFWNELYGTGPDDKY